MWKKLLLAAMLAINSFAQITFLPPTAGGAVGGASTLSTAGAVPYVVSAGVLGQDVLWNWDSTNKRSVSGNAATGNSTSYNTYAVWGHSSLMTAGGIALVAGSAGDVYLNSGPSAALSFRQNATEVARFAPTTANFLLGGGTTDGNYKFDVNRSGSTGTLRAFNQAVGGSTLVVLRAGDTQSGNLLEIQNNAGVAYSYFSSLGALVASDLTSGTNIRAGAGYSIGFTSRSLIFAPSDGVFTFYNAATSDFNRLQFGGTTNAYGAIARNGAGFDFKLADNSAYTTVRASNYISNDGSTGITGATCSSFKNGICVAP